MRDDIDPQKPTIELTLFCAKPFKHSNGTHIWGRDYTGYRVVMKTGETRTFLKLNPQDTSPDWLNVTEQFNADHFTVYTEKLKSVPNLHPSEVEDLNNELSRCHRSPNEFEISATCQRLDDESGAVSAARGTVTIRNRESGAERTYETGHASTWVEQFASDLQRGVL